MLDTKDRIGRNNANLTLSLTIAFISYVKGGNKLTGKIPTEISNLMYVSYLDVGKCGPILMIRFDAYNIHCCDGISFQIAHKLTKNYKFQLLIMYPSCHSAEGNQLSGSIPIEFGKLKELKKLDLSKYTIRTIQYESTLILCH